MSKPLTSAAIRTGYSDASNASIQPTPLRPATAASHVDGASSPIGVTAPRPVMTTRRMEPRAYSRSGHTTTGSAPLLVTVGRRPRYGCRRGPRAPKQRARRAAGRPRSARSRSRRWRPSSSASCPRATSGSTSRSGTASAACSRTPPASCASGRGTRGRCCATSRSSRRSASSCRRDRASTARS